MAKKQNIFENLPVDLSEEVIEILHSDNIVKIERIVSKGHSMEEGIWYDQETDEFVILLSGSAELEFSDAQLNCKLKPGDYLMIPAHKKHRIKKTNPDKESVWLAIHISQ